MDDEIKRQREETYRVICESREMDAKLMESWSRLEAQTKEMIKSQTEPKESIRELEVAIAAGDEGRTKWFINEGNRCNSRDIQVWGAFEG